MEIFRRIVAWISSLKIAIFLLFMIAMSSAIGTAIPQGETRESYIENFGKHPWLGFINGETLINLQLNHVYSSTWFLSLLAWLGLSLMLCSWRRQWPILQAALRWVDYTEPKQLRKLSIASTISLNTTSEALEQLSNHLQTHGWQVKAKPGRLAARKGVIGRIGPPIIHVGLILLLIGAAWGALNGQQLEKFLAPGRSFNLLNEDGINQITLKLNHFQIDRDPVGRPEQFRSSIELIKPLETHGEILETSVNHPIRYNGITIYQADWSLAAITLQIDKSPKLQLPLQSFPQLGQEIWGVVIPTKPNGQDSLLFAAQSEAGPIQVFNENGKKISSLRPGADAKEINGVPIKVINILPASGLLLKHDPGVPIVYSSFAITLIGGLLSLISTRQLWAISEPDKSIVHIGVLSNKNLSGLANQIPVFKSVLLKKNPT